ncbi:MAG: hypothetical protein QNJ70_18550 [Xenococcaceae cyanobacterium MO_207.B15]|nr:hypothetical protein [Xenococcaceae cyanobacterium MO_207.B15]
MVKIICLANSKKNGDRCIAGIDICTGKWIRPVSDKNDGRVSRDICLINNEEPQPLDLLDIPLENNKGNGYECENLIILPGKWEKIGQVLPKSLLKYYETEIMYSQYPKAVPYSVLKSLQPNEIRTLQLVKATVNQIHKYEDSQRWEASLSISKQQTLTAKVTDVVMIDKLNQGLDIKGKECLFTISLAQPWQKNDSDELSCWKLIAGVIELS